MSTTPIFIPIPHAKAGDYQEADRLYAAVRQVTTEEARNIGKAYAAANSNCHGLLNRVMRILGRQLNVLESQGGENAACSRLDSLCEGLGIARKAQRKARHNRRSKALRPVSAVIRITLSTTDHK